MKFLPGFNPVSSCSLNMTQMISSVPVLSQRHWNTLKIETNVDLINGTQPCCLTCSACTNPTPEIFILTIDFSTFGCLSLKRFYTFSGFISVNGATQWKEWVANGSHSPQPSHFLCAVNVESLVSGAPSSSVASPSVVECEPLKGNHLVRRQSRAEPWKKSNDSLYFQPGYQSVTGPQSQMHSLCTLCDTEILFSTQRNVVEEPYKRVRSDCDCDSLSVCLWSPVGKFFDWLITVFNESGRRWTCQIITRSVSHVKNRKAYKRDFPAVGQLCAASQERNLQCLQLHAPKAEPRARWTVEHHKLHKVDKLTLNPIRTRRKVWSVQSVVQHGRCRACNVQEHLIVTNHLASDVELDASALMLHLISHLSQPNSVVGIKTPKPWAGSCCVIAAALLLVAVLERCFCPFVVGSNCRAADKMSENQQPFKNKI